MTRRWGRRHPAPSSRPRRAGARAALVLEASADGGALKLARKGVSTYEVHVTGRAAHAGLEPERGANAAIELAHQVLAIAALGDAGCRHDRDPDRAAPRGPRVNTVPGERGRAGRRRARGPRPSRSGWMPASAH